MTDEEARRMLARMESLAAEVESLRREVADARRAAEDAAAAKEDSADFGGGGEPDWSGAMGKVPDGMVENPAIPPLPDTTAAKDPNRLQYKSIDDRAQDNAPPGVTQIHDFDEAPLSNTRRIELKSVTTTGTGGGRKLQLVDPDGNADFRTKWMVPLREAGTGGREIKWVCIGGEACLPVPTFTASVAAGTGTPGVVVTPGGTECAPTVDLAFSGLQGPAGPAGRDGDDGCSPEISVTVLEPGSTQGGEAGGFLVAIQNYERVNGQCVAVGDLLTFVVKNGAKGEDGDPGADGCTPTVTAGTTPSEHGDLAFTITPCGEGATPISVYHGKNGAPGAGLSGTFITSIGPLTVSGTTVTLAATKVTYANGVPGAVQDASVTYQGTDCGGS